MSDKSAEESLRYYGASDPLGLGQVAEIWSARELLYSFFLRDLLIRYRQVVVGIVWVLLQPLIGMLIFMGLFFVLGTKAGGANVAYAATIFVGMLCWQLVSASLRDATGSLVNYRHVVTKIYFPRMLLPLASLMCALFDFCIGCLLIVPIVYWTGTTIVWSTAWMVVPCAIGLTLFCIGCAAWLSALNAHYRDVGYALPFALQIGMFVSPVVYDLERIRQAIPQHWMILYEANPVASCISGMRWALFGSEPPSALGLAASCLTTLVLLLSGFAWFQHADKRLADRI